MLKNNNIPGVLTYDIRYMDDKFCLYYDIKDMISMKYIDTTPVPITLEKGQYLLMMNCRFTAQTSSASGPGADLASGVNSAIQTLLDAIKQFGA